jgi:hypothetical protein
MDIDKVHEYLTTAIDLAEKRQSYKELSRIYKLFYDGYRSISKPTQAKQYLEKHNECVNKLTQFEEENYLKTFTANHDFDFKFDSLSNIEILNKNLHLKGNVLYSDFLNSIE